MRIDVNAYLGRWDFRSKGIDDPEVLLGKEAEAGVDIAIVSCPQGVMPDGTFEANQELLEKITPYAGRLFMVARTDPAWDVEQTVAFLDHRAVAAIRLPAIRNEQLVEQEREIVQAAVSRQLPIYLTLGVAHLWDVAEEMDPDLVAVFASEYPIAAFVVAGDGQFQYPKLNNSISTYSNIYCDTSRNSGLGFVDKYAREFGVERILFGTTAGILHPCLARDKVQVSSLSAPEKVMIYSDNTMRIFGRISPPIDTHPNNIV